MPIDFSIILPSRDRQRLLTNLLRSIEKNTGYLNKVEVLVAYDNDDGAMESYAYWAKENIGPWVKFYDVPRSSNFSKDYYTYLYNQSSGRWVIACNDDAEFITPNWDIEAKKALGDYIKSGPNVVYGWIEDELGTSRMTQFGDYCCFPLLGRDGVDSLGYYFSDAVPIWGADIWLQKLYKNVSKVCKIPFTIKHISHHNGLREQDELNKRLASINAKIQCSMQPTYEEINNLICAIKPEQRELIHA